MIKYIYLNYWEKLNKWKNGKKSLKKNCKAKLSWYLEILS